MVLFRNVFSWKSGSTDSTLWKLFGKGGAQCNKSPLHSVASSSALIQLKRCLLKKSPKLAYKVVDFRPATLPAKTQEEEQKHTQEYSEILAAAKRKEAKSTAVKEKLKKIQLQLEEQQAAAAKHFTQLVIPNWSQM